MIFALLLAAGGGHLYVLPSKVLFLLPADENACGVTTVRYGPSDGKWETGSNFAAPDCHFRTWVKPGPLLPAWSDPGGKAMDGSIDVTYTVHGGSKPVTVTVQAEKIQPSTDGKLAATATKAQKNVRVEVTNKGDKAVMLGDSVASRGRPKDECLGPGPAAVLQSGETLIDIRPGLLSKSMSVWVSEFSDEKTCKWVEVKR